MLVELFKDSIPKESYYWQFTFSPIDFPAISIRGKYYKPSLQDLHVADSTFSPVEF
jgi:hypothetical protein